MNPKKFGSLNLDIPSSSYEFLKFATKSRKINKEKIQPPDWQLGSAGQRAHVSVR